MIGQARRQVFAVVGGETLEMIAELFGASCDDDVGRHGLQVRERPQTACSDQVSGDAVETAGFRVAE